MDRIRSGVSILPEVLHSASSELELEEPPLSVPTLNRRVQQVPIDFAEIK